MPEKVIAPIDNGKAAVFCIVKVLVIVVPVFVFPKSVQSVTTGEVSPSDILVAFPNKFISGETPVPFTEKSYGFSLLSLLAIDIVAVLVP